ncbi:MAG: hypothetical protein Q8Q39_00530 [bacterium]|nr:hypothetical protein [bacterium]
MEWIILLAIAYFWVMALGACVRNPRINIEKFIKNAEEHEKVVQEAIALALATHAEVIRKTLRSGNPWMTVLPCGYELYIEPAIAGPTIRLRAQSENLIV